MLYGDCPISQFRERLSCTEIEVLCRAHALSLCSPRPPVSWTPRAQTWVTSSLDSEQQCCLSSRSRVGAQCQMLDLASSQHWLGWFGDLVMDARALILPIWRPASSGEGIGRRYFTALAGYFEVLLFMVRSSARTSGRTSWRGRRIVVFSKSVNHFVIGYNIRVVAESHDGVGKAGPGRADAVPHFRVRPAGTRSLWRGMTAIGPVRTPVALELPGDAMG